LTIRSWISERIRSAAVVLGNHPISVGMTRIDIYYQAIKIIVNAAMTTMIPRLFIVK
jgi:hypothetical protein